MSAHDEMLDNVAVYALGTMSADEARVVEEHLRTCDECRAEYDALRPVVTAVGNAVGTDYMPSVLLKARIMKAVRGEVTPAWPTPSFSWIPYAFAAASLLLAAGFGAVIVEQSHAIAELANARRVAFSQGNVLVAPDRLYIAVHGLAALPAGKVYQLWTLAKGATKVAPSVTFTPDQHGSALLEIADNSESTVATAISVEPTGGSQQPTTKPIVMVKLGGP